MGSTRMLPADPGSAESTGIVADPRCNPPPDPRAGPVGLRAPPRPAHDNLRRACDDRFMCPRHAAWKVALAITSLLLGCGARTSLDAPPRRDAAIEDAIPARDAETDGRIVEVDAAICGGECDDGIYCNGREVCDGLTRRCQPGPPPSCDDGIECTVDSCDPGVDACRSEPVDRDGDGDGVSACDGDCDDADPARYPGAAELCDGLDQDCDGEIDEGALSECGDCRPGCQILSMPGETGGWGVRAGSSGGVAVDPSGGLRLDTSRTETNHAWIANSAPGTVTKLDMRTGAQLAEFDSALLDGRNGARPAGERCQTERLGGNCPSRTAIDLRGNVYVANRAFFAQGTVTKIAGAVDDCVDRNRNLRIDTSRDLDGNGLIDRSTPGEFLGQDDECILWTVDVGGVGGLPRAIAVAADGGVWVGLHDGRRVLELDPLTGGTRRSIAIAFNPYGAAIDSRARLWLLEVGSGRITSIDTSTGERGETVVTTDRSDCAGGYGIAIDSRDRVWTA
ncbi:MAG: MopE-related protein, partial [Myxococcales bacterium]|nr:MopE-related protein [Myxococcales bacterium]